MLFIIILSVLIISAIIAKKAKKRHSTVVENIAEEIPLGYETGSYNPEPAINIPVEKAAEKIATNIVKPKVKMSANKQKNKKQQPTKKLKEGQISQNKKQNKK